MIHPDTELVLISPRIGRGVRATTRIPTGTLVWVRDRFDRVLSPSEVAELDAAHRRLVETWGYRDARGHWVLCSDAGRFVNHSCEPNIRGLGIDMQIAVRPIEIGEEVTCDYAECNALLRCACGAPSCRQLVHPEDVFEHAAKWDAEVRAALAHAAEIPQPLLRYAVDWRRFQKWAGGSPVPSLTNVYFDADADPEGEPPKGRRSRA